MNSRPFDPPATSPFGDWRTVLAVAAVVVVACVAISGRSLWIDEACTATKAVPPTLGGWWQALSQDRSADAQMPLYMLYVWGWARLFGSSEWSLHAANVPWFLAGAVALSWPFRPVIAAGSRRLAWCCSALSPGTTWMKHDHIRCS